MYQVVFKSSTIASMRAKDFEHASKVCGKYQKVTETYVSNAVMLWS